MQPINKKMLALKAIALAAAVGGSVSVVNAKSFENEDNGRHKGEARQEARFWHQAEQKFKNGLFPSWGKHKRVLPGIVKSKSNSGPTDGTIVITKGNKEFTIKTSNTTDLKNRKGGDILWGDIQVGHKISVRGKVTRTDAGGDVTEVVFVRDRTLPIENN